MTDSRFRPHARLVRSLIGASALALLTACTSIGETQVHGHLLSDSDLEQIPPGSSQEQVLVVLGSPSTTSTIDGKTFYYIQSTAHRPVAFMRSRTIDRRVVAVYFDQNDQVERVANYGMQDGVVFDFISRTTPTTGRELTFVRQIIQAATGSTS